MAKRNSIENFSQDLTIDPGASGDSIVQFDINGTAEWQVGVDDDDSDKIKISQGDSLGTTDAWVMTASGERTQSLQPSFSVTNTLQSNFAGDGNFYPVPFATAYYDIGLNFSGSTFIAPVTGKFLLTATVVVSGLASGHIYYQVRFSTSNHIYLTSISNPYALRDANGEYGRTSSVLVDMDAADTAQVLLYVYNGAKSVDLPAGKSLFSGRLVC